RLLQRIGGPHERPAQTIVAFDPVVLEPADVAHPVAVDVWIETRREPDQPRSLRPLRLGLDPGRDAAALRALRADGVGGLRVVPRPRLEPVVARRNGADRAYIHQVP